MFEGQPMAISSSESFIRRPIQQVLSLCARPLRSFRAALRRALFAAIGLLAPLRHAGDIPLSGLRGFKKWFRPHSLRRLRPRVFSGLFLQTKVFLPPLAPEARGAVRRAALRQLAQGRAASARGVFDPQNPARCLLNERKLLSKRSPLRPGGAKRLLAIFCSLGRTAGYPPPPPPGAC